MATLLAGRSDEDDGITRVEDAFDRTVEKERGRALMERLSKSDRDTGGCDARTHSTE